MKYICSKVLVKMNKLQYEDSNAMMEKKNVL